MNICVILQSTACVELLLRNDADPNACNTATQPALMLAVTSGLSDTSNSDILCEWQWHVGNAGLGQILLRGRADPNITRFGSASLHLAVAAGKVDVCHMLLASGANPMQRDKLQRTSLDVSSY